MAPATAGEKMLIAELTKNLEPESVVIALANALAANNDAPIKLIWKNCPVGSVYFSSNFAEDCDEVA